MSQIAFNYLKMKKMSEDEIAEYIEGLSSRRRRTIGLVLIQLFFGLIGLFFYPLKSIVAVLLLPYVAFALAHIGHVPFAGFLLYYWIYEYVVLQIWWYDYMGLSPTLYTKFIWIVYQVQSFLFSLRSSTNLVGLAEVETEEVKS